MKRLLLVCVAVPFEMLRTPLGTMGLLAAGIVALIVADVGCTALSPTPGKTTAGGDVDQALGGVVAYQSAFGAGAALVVALAVIAVTVLGLALRRVALSLVDALRRSKPCEGKHVETANHIGGERAAGDTRCDR